jgi:GAF domain-containing protein
VILENAGAQQGCFIVIQAKNLNVEVSFNKDGSISQNSIPLEQFSSICLSAVQYTVNTNESIVLEHAIQTGRFMRDPYVTANQTKSLMCLPIHLQNRLSGVLYLENNLLPGAFATHQLEMLRIIATQTMFLLKLFPYERGQEHRELLTDLPV